MVGVSQFILRFKCPDSPGLMAQITTLLWGNGCDIRDAAVYGDPDTKEFFVRMHIAVSKKTRATLEDAFAPLARKLDLDWSLIDLDRKIRILVAVSKSDHCLNDLLYKRRIGSIPIDVVGVVSNHDNLRSIVEADDIPYHYLPITQETKSKQEAAFQLLIEDVDADLIVLARYMQVLSDEFSNSLAGRCMNIHHSFLPGFKGAKPYHQAHERGVKLIGATAHFVTADLDEGPIIEQDVRRVTHAATAQEMIEIGRDTEAAVLSRAVKWIAEHRVFLNGSRTVIL